MARPKLAPVVIDQPAVDEGAVRRDLTTLDQLTTHRSTAIARIGEEFGVSLPTFDVDLYFNHVKFLSGQVSELLLQQGVWLIALKEALPHGEFQTELQKRGVMSYRSAAVIMQATRRLATDGGQKFLANVRNDASLSRSRLLELAVNMDEADLSALADDDGEVAGHTREEYLGMSRSELLATLKRRDSSLDEGATQLEDAEKKLKAATKAKKRAESEDPAGDRVKLFEAELVAASSDAAKLVRKDMADIVADLHADTEALSLTLDDTLEARVADAIKQALQRVTQSATATAAALGIDPAAVGLTGEEFMPADFE